MLWRDVTFEAMPDGVELAKLKNRFGVVLGCALFTDKTSAPPAVMAAAKKREFDKALFAARRRDCVSAAQLLKCV